MKPLTQSLTRLVSSYPPLVWVRLFGETLTTLASSMIAPFLVLYLSEHISSSVTLTMLVIGLQPFTEILLTIFAGGITDRFSRKAIMTSSLLLQGFAMLGMAFVDAMTGFALLYVLNGAGRALFIPASRALFADTIPADKMPSAFALLNTATSIGAATGPLVGVLIYQRDPALAFLLTACSLLAYAIAVWRKIPRTDIIHTYAQESADEQPAAGLGAYRPALALMVLCLPISLFYAQTETNLQLHFKNTLPNYVETLALLMSVKGGLLIALEFLLVKWTQHLSARRLITGSYLCFFLVAIGYAFVDNVPALIALQIFLVLGESIGLTQLLTMVSRIAPSSMRGRYFAITGTHWDISRTCGPYVGSLVLIHFGGAWLFSITAALLLIGAWSMNRYLLQKEKALPLEREG